MLKYIIDEFFLKSLSNMSRKERFSLLWLAQNVLSHCPGYLKAKVKSFSDELSLYKTGDNLYLEAYEDDGSRILLGAFASNVVPGTILKTTSNAAEATIVSLLQDPVAFPSDELETVLEKNYFTKWFRALLAKLSTEQRASITAVIKPIEVKKEEEKVVAPVVETPKVEVPKETIAPIINKPIERKSTPKKDAEEGALYEKAILEQLQNAYEQRKIAKSQSQGSLHHVHLAKQEIVISYNNDDECLGLLLKRTKKYGLHDSGEGWAILLANTVEETLASKIMDAYPGHVFYTDDPKKGSLEKAIIVKRNREEKREKIDDTGCKKILDKRASFHNEVPEGAFSNIDEEEVEDEPRHSGDNSLRLVKDKRASFEPVIAEVQVDEEEENGDEDFDIGDEDPFNNVEENPSLPTDEEGDPLPKFWHCFLCGKKKIYSGQPAETITRRDGTKIYLCKKHRGKM